MEGGRVERYSGLSSARSESVPGNSMSSATLKRALDLALELPESERAALAHDLLASLDGTPDANAQQAWEAEIVKRLDELETGKVRTIDADEALRRIDDRIRRG
jgi:putative addiction module component (TIGR02574 family)